MSLETITMEVKRLRPGAKLPYYASEASAGMDLVACIDQPVIIQPNQRQAIPTGIAIALPRRDLVALIFARSGLALRQGLALANGVGVVDADYRGEILCAMLNTSDQTVTVNPGDRIAQMVIMPICVAGLVDVEELDATTRGAGGFGSTGVKA
jgi:dUTP pyrophosphatase